MGKSWKQNAKNSKWREAKQQKSHNKSYRVKLRPDDNNQNVDFTNEFATDDKGYVS